MKTKEIKLIDINTDTVLTDWFSGIVPDIGDKVKIDNNKTLFIVQREFNVSDSNKIKCFGMLNVSA